ncbi:MAG: polysaccharide biosynthesis/export family protein, partial [Deltaproteobacteria bacterium]|nr:polysaccharide biosynthesis/export family protein [Deltaproteobacteria bacterium]
MNFVKCRFFIACISKKYMALGLFLTSLLLPIYLFGCSDQVTLPTTEKLAEFENAGPLRPTVDMDRLVKAKISGGPYKVVRGDVLELTMPAILQAITDDQSGTPDQVKPYPFRIGESGTINLSTVGEIKVVGKTLSQIESAVIDAYYPAYAVTQPSVFVRVIEYETAKVSIAGAVNKPGIYSLRSDQMSLVALIMEAGGIVDEGAVVIKILHRDPVVPNNEQAVIETAREAFEQPVGLNKTKHSKFIGRYPGSNDLEILLSFRQAAPSGTIGTLTIMHDQKRLLTEQTDLADK